MTDSVRYLEIKENNSKAEVLYIVFICAITKSEFSFPRSSSHRINIFSKPVSNLKRSDEYRIPEGKTIRKLNQLKRQLLLMCLTGGSRKIRAVDTEGRFFFPTVIQQTGVNVGGSGSHEDQVDSGDGGEGFSNNCDSLTTSGLLGHPHLVIIVSELTEYWKRDDFFEDLQCNRYFKHCSLLVNGQKAKDLAKKINEYARENS
ncbi:hypothetical protein PGB90_006548 [Kerria lacca]